MHKIFLSLMLWIAALAPAAAAAGVPHSLRACGDANEFAPFHYMLREAGRKTERIAGFDVDVLQKIMADTGHTLHIEMLPWARCLVLASHGEIDIVMGGIKSPQRARDFVFASSHYALTPIFVYLKAGPKPVLTSSKALSSLRVCSQAEYNYAPFGVPDSMIRNRARSIDDAATMLKLGRCGVMLQQVEILRGNVLAGGVDLMDSADFSYEIPSWIGRIELQFMVGRTLPHRDALIALLDRGLAGLTKSGELERMRAANYTRH